MPETLEMAGADNNRHVRRQAARKHSIDGCLLRCNRPLADALDADDVSGRKAGYIQTFSDAVFGRGTIGRPSVHPFAG